MESISGKGENQIVPITAVIPPQSRNHTIKY